MHALIRPLLLVLLLGAPALPSSADDTPAADSAQASSPEMEAMFAALAKAAALSEEHQSLKNQTGQWKATVTAWNAPDAPPTTSQGVFERQLILGGRVLEERYQGDVMGMPFQGRGLLGFDNVTQRWWTMWMDNMSTGPMVLWGAWDESENAIVYEGTTPDPLSGQLLPMRTVVRHPNADQEVVTMFDLSSGSPVKTMEITTQRN